MLSWSSRIWRFEKATGIAVNFVGMLTKYTLTIGSTEHDIPDECLKNWDEISFSLSRSDYSGVMRSFSTEFIFVGNTKDLLWELYIEDGFKADATVAVYTITDTHEWEKQYEAALDFSTIEIEDDALTINALDDSLGSLIKSKKTQKYEYPVSDFSFSRINVERMEIVSYALFNFQDTGINDLVNLNLNDDSSAVISKEYIEPTSQAASNSFFAHCNKHGASLNVRVQGTMRCFFNPLTPYKDIDGTLTPGSDVPVGRLDLYADYQLDSSGFQLVGTFSFDDDVRYRVIGGVRTMIFVNYAKENVYSSLSELNAQALAQYGQGGRIPITYNGIFGVVGNYSDYTQSSYWDYNTVYEYQNGQWYAKGAPADYYQDRPVNEELTISDQKIWNDTHVRLKCRESMFLSSATLYIQWNDPIRSVLSCRGVTPLELITKVVRSITGEQTVVSIEADNAGLIAETILVCGEELRQISSAKIYTSFADFAGWMEAVFGYTYSVVGDTLQFLHRSSVFDATVSKVIDSYSELTYAVDDSLIYSIVDAGYSKKDYGEIDGRYETNFTNNYSTGYDITDKKLSLVSKYRSDRYGVEFTARKSESETKDDKADEDIFFIRFVLSSGGVNTYTPTNQLAYAPAVCVENNKGFIAAVGNGAAVTLTMTASDGNNTLADITIPAGSNLFTCGEIEFTTDDMVLPSDLNALVQLDHNGYRYTGFISEAECRYGKLNGVQYKLIVKDITEI